MLAAHADDNPWCHERSFAAAYFASEDVLRCAHEAYVLIGAQVGRRSAR